MAKSNGPVGASAGLMVVGERVITLATPLSVATDRVIRIARTRTMPALGLVLARQQIDGQAAR